MRFLSRLLALPLLGLFLTAAAHAADAPEIPYVEVTGRAERVLDYDRVRLTFDFVAESRESADATRQLADRLSKAAKALDGAGFKAPDVEAAGPWTTPRYAQVQEDRGNVSTQTQRIGSYESRGSVTVRTGDFSAVSRLTDLLLAQGATMQEPSFFLDRADELTRALAPEAARDALARARQIIEGVGGKPGRILSIQATDSPGDRPVFQMSVAARAKTAAPPVDIPLLPGKARLSTGLTLRVEILQP